MMSNSSIPSAFDLASAWGLEIGKNKTTSYKWGGLLDELMVSNAGSAIYSDCGGELMRKKKSPSCGKQNQVILKQLLEFLADDGNSGDGMGPPTPCSGHGGWRIENNYEEQLQENEKQEEEGGGFTSLLMMQTSTSPKEEVNTLWNNSSCDHSAQKTGDITLINGKHISNGEKQKQWYLCRRSRSVGSGKRNIMFSSKCGLVNPGLL